jgi:hypothetical protein
MMTEALGLLVSIAIPFSTLAMTATPQLAANPGGGAWTIFLLGFSSDALIAVFKSERPARASNPPGNDAELLTAARG